MVINDAIGAAAKETVSLHNETSLLDNNVHALLSLPLYISMTGNILVFTSTYISVEEVLAEVGCKAAAALKLPLKQLALQLFQNRRYETCIPLLLPSFIFCWPTRLVLNSKDVSLTQLYFLKETGTGLFFTWP